MENLTVKLTLCVLDQTSFTLIIVRYATGNEFWSKNQRPIHSQIIMKVNGPDRLFWPHTMQTFSSLSPNHSGTTSPGVTPKIANRLINCIVRCCFFRVRKSSWSLVIRTCSHYVSELGISVQ